VAKYCDHQPLYRQSLIYAREGVVIERSTTAGWVGQSEKLPDPLGAALGRYVLAGTKLQPHTARAEHNVGGSSRSRSDTAPRWTR